MDRYIGHITEETWPEARAILDAFRVGHRTEANRYAGHMKGYNVWVETEGLTGEPWWEELVEANRNGRIEWQIVGQGYGEPVL
ncbi:hypothetical protein BH23ACT11_BH23ACT11_04130 [soil metagenome]